MIATNRRALREAKVSNRELARRLDIGENQVRRLLNLDHRSHIGDVERALRALGQEVEVELTLRPAA